MMPGISTGVVAGPYAALGSVYQELSPATQINGLSIAATSLTMDTPPQAAKYDLLVASIFTRGNKFNAPSGWALAAEHDFGVAAGAPNGVTTQIFYTFLSGAPSGSYAFPRSIAGAAHTQGLIDCYRRTNTRTVTLVASGGQGNGIGTTFAGPSLTLGVDDVLLVAAVGLGGSFGRPSANVLGDFAVANLSNTTNATIQPGYPDIATIPTDKWEGSYFAINGLSSMYSCGFARHVPGVVASTGAASVTASGTASEGAVAIAAFRMTR